MAHLFTYGSLMCSDIFSKVAGYLPDSTQARLSNFFRSRIHGREYPGIVPRPEKSVSGVLYFDLSSEALQRLDIFEGNVYQRQNVQVTTEQDRLVTAMTYVIKPQHRNILTEEAWNFEDFLAAGKAEFEKTYFGFAEIEHEPQEDVIRHRQDLS